MNIVRSDMKYYFKIKYANIQKKVLYNEKRRGHIIDENKNLKEVA